MIDVYCVVMVADVELSIFLVLVVLIVTVPVDIFFTTKTFPAFVVGSGNVTVKVPLAKIHPFDEVAVKLVVTVVGAIVAIGV